MRDRFLRILAAVAANPECPLAELLVAEDLSDQTATAAR
jgi:hypothetical protein